MFLNSLLKDSAKMILGQAAVFALGLISAVIISRMLGPEGRGIQSWIVTLTSVGVHLGLLGMDTVNRQSIGSSPEKAPSMVTLSLLMALCSCIILIPLLFSFGLTQPIGKENSLPLLIGVFTLPAALLTSSLGAVLIALNRVGDTTLNILLGRIALLATIIILSINGSLSINGVLFAHWLAPGIGVIWLIFCLKKHIRKIKWALPELKTLHGFIGGAYIAGLGVFLMQKVDMIMLGSLSTAVETGYYSVATTLIDALYIIPGIPVYLALSKLSNQTDEEFKTSVKNLRLILIAGLTIMVAVLWSIAPWGIPFLFGQTFAASVNLFQWLLPALVLFSLLNLEQMLLAARKPLGWQLGLAPLIGATINLSLNWLFIPQYGAVGAAWASIIAYGAGWVVATLIRSWVKKSA